MSKILIGALAVLAIGAAVFITSMNRPASAPTSETGTPTSTFTADDAREYAWKFEDTERAGPVPHTRVILETNGKTYPLGEYEGSCFEIAASAWGLSEGELSGAICWFAGGGSELGVFKENGKLVVKKGDIEEGDAENPGFRGNFKTVLELK